MFEIRLKSSIFAAAALGTLLVAAPGGAVAQDRVYTASEVGTPASVKNRGAAAGVIERSYPRPLHKIGGKVQLQMVVRADGTVDPATVKVVVATVTALGAAATRAAKDIEFTPARVDGRAVASVVLFPVTYGVR